MNESVVSFYSILLSLKILNYKLTKIKTHTEMVRTFSHTSITSISHNSSSSNATESLESITIETQIINSPSLPRVQEEEIVETSETHNQRSLIKNLVSLKFI